MLDVELIVQPSVDPALAPAFDRWLLNRVARDRQRGALCVRSLAGDAVVLGRYHLAPAARVSGPALVRRHSGGRAWPAGQAYAGVALALPHRSALVSDDPLALRPEQVLNRCVRGVLAACRLARIDAFYPGRDLVTVGGRAIAAVSFEVDCRGLLLFEAVLCVGGGLDSLPALLDAADPGGEVTAHPWSPEETTWLSRELGGQPAIEDAADLLRRGFAEKLAVPLRPFALGEDDWGEIRALAGVECGEDQWLRARARRAGLDRRSRVATQLGVLEALLALGPRREIAEVLLAGDFIANSPAIAALEERLRSRDLERDAIGSAIEQTFGEPGNFILGIGRPDAIADLLLAAGAP